MINNPSDPNIHMWAGNLLFSIGAFEDAIKAYSNISNINKNSNIVINRKNIKFKSKNIFSFKKI